MATTRSISAPASTTGRLATETSYARARGRPSAGAQPAALDTRLRETVAEATRLLGADGGLLYIVDPAGGLRLIHDVGVTDRAGGAWAAGLRLAPGQGLFGRAAETATPQLTADYSTDPSFSHSPDTDRVVAQAGIHSMVAAPMVAGDEVLGVLGVFSTRHAAFGDADVALVGALAGHAAISLANARLIDELDRSRAELGRRAETERSLREIGADLARIREPGRLLQRVVDEATRLVGADASILALLEADGLLHWSYDDGLRLLYDQELVAALTLESGVGVTGRALAEGRVLIRNERLVEAFPRSPESSRFFEVGGFRSMVAAPIVGETRPFGALEVYSRREGAFGEEDAIVLSALADQAAVAIANARLIEELAGSRRELAWRVEAERSLREMAGRLAAIRDPAVLLQRIVDDAARLPGADWAELATVDDAGLIAWAYDAGLPGDLREPLYRLPLHVGEGVLGRAAAERRVVVTDDYLADPAFVHQESADAFTRMAGFRSLVAAPLVTEAGVIGVLGVHSTRRAAFDADRVGIVAAFASHAAIAIGNARLIDALDRSQAELRESEARYRHLVKASPDVVWAVDGSGRFTFVSDRIEALAGIAPETLIGRHFAELMMPDSMPASTAVWEAVRAQPGGVYPLAILLPRREGPPVPVEIWVTGIVHEGRFDGAHGSMRDMRERERLTRELQTQAAELAASRERAHLAGELHDSVTQALFSMTLVSRSIELLLARDPSRVPAKLATLRELQADALAEMRALIFELRPASLETDGLLAALRTHAAAVEGRTGLTIVVEAPELERLPIELETAAFRIAQEALHNVVKHAGASRVRLLVERETGELRLTVEDDGMGFEPAQVAGDHLGLAGMRARAEKLGGSLAVESAPGRGTRIRTALPT